MGCDVWVLDELIVLFDVFIVKVFVEIVKVYLVVGGCVLIVIYVDFGFEGDIFDVM